MGFALLISTILPSKALAAENKYSEGAETACRIVDYTVDEFSSEMEELYEKVIFDGDAKVGDVQVLGKWGEEEFCVEVVDITESSYATYAANETSEKTTKYIFYKKNILGIKTNLFSVTSTCTWIKGDKIINLHCVYEILKTGVSCSWNDDYKSASDTFHLLALDASYGGDSRFILFSAGLSMDKQELTLNYSGDFDL